jgi:hypothetical protein
MSPAGCIEHMRLAYAECNASGIWGEQMHVHNVQNVLTKKVVQTVDISPLVTRARKAGN